MRYLTNTVVCTTKQRCQCEVTMSQ